ncbi:hypothetical protein HDV00_007380 [Rhizophlyctis rosea]|nr:hypothetical protein HDV00_007380 [Rhizophlyctis rosea]
MPDPEIYPDRHPHMYIYNSASFARLWMPCFDYAHDRCSWEVDLVVPRTEWDCLPDDVRALTDTDAETDDWNREMVAVCSGALCEQIVHPAYQDKKVFSFQLDSPVAASSITVAVGAFEVVPIPGWVRRPPRTGSPVPDEAHLGDEEEGEEEGEPCGFGFCLPERVDDMVYTLEFFAQAAEFLEEYMTTSYPFPVYNHVFVEDAYNSVMSGATMAIVSSHLLFWEEIIDQVYDTRRLLCRAFASQWFGHLIRPKGWADAWLIVGLVNYASGMFLQHLFGNNEYKYRLKKDMDRVCALDVNQPPMCTLPDSTTDLQTIDPLLLPFYDPSNDTLSPRSHLMSLKSPIILHMLDRRFKGLLPKLISTINMTAISGDLPQGLSTHYFLRQAGKVVERRDVDIFADQWIHKSGVPRFRFGYTFNRKHNYVYFDVGQECSNLGGVGAAKMFIGSFLIQVQEPGGIFEKEILINEAQMKVDYPYSTKYKRTRTVKKKEEEGVEEGEWVGRRPERITMEYIRFDPELDWCCEKVFEQDDYQWGLQLRKEVDVWGQMEAIEGLRTFTNVGAMTALFSAIGDTTLFYRVRMQAVDAFAKVYNEQEAARNPQLRDVVRAYEERYCHAPGDVGGVAVPREPVGGAFPMAMLMMSPKTAKGLPRVEVRRALIGLLRYNDNTRNEYSDTHFLATIISALGDAFLPSHERDRVRPQHNEPVSLVRLNEEDVEEFGYAEESDDEGGSGGRGWSGWESEEEAVVFRDAMGEVERYLGVDRLLGSFGNGVTVACLETLMKWMLGGIIPIDLAFFAKHARYGNFLNVRLTAINALLLLDGFRTVDVPLYLLKLVERDPSPFVRYHVAKALADAVCVAAGERGGFEGGDGEEKWGKMRREVAGWGELSSEVWEVMNSKTCKDHRVILALLKFCEMVYDPAPTEVEVTLLKIVVPTVGLIGAGKRVRMGDVSDDEPLVRQPKRSKSMREDGEATKQKAAVVPDKPPPPLDPAFKELGGTILTRLTNHHCVTPFLRPVNPESAPGYAGVVHKPMDLMTARQKLNAGSYYNEIKLLETDILQIFENCFLYNRDGSQVYEQGRKLKAFFVDEVLPEETGRKAKKVVEERIEIQPAVPMVVPEVPVTKVSGIPVPKAVVKLSARVQQKMPVEDVKRMKGIVQRLMEHPAGLWFKEPVDPERHGAPNYFQIVKKPMDLGTVQNKLDKGVYGSVNEVAEDVRLVFSNCFAYNVPGTQVHNDGKTLKGVFEKEFARVGKSGGGSVTPPSRSASPAPVAVGKGKTPAQGLSSEETAKVDAVLKKMEVRQDLVLPFLAPVPRDVRGYHDVIKQPMDLGTIRKKVREGRYGSLGEFEGDVRLMFRNCFVFNPEGDPVRKLGKRLEGVFEIEWGVGGGSGVKKEKEREREREKDERRVSKSGSVVGREKSVSRGESPIVLNKPLVEVKSSIPRALVGRKESSVGGGSTSSRSSSPVPGGAGTTPTPTPAPPSQRITESDIKAIHAIFERLQQHPRAGIFVGPVDRSIYTDYYEKIREPTDLLTMDQKLLGGEFGRLEEVERQVGLMVANCEKYNGGKSEPAKWARELEKVFRREWKVFLEKRSVTPEGSRSSTPVPSPAGGSQHGKKGPMTERVKGDVLKCLDVVMSQTMSPIFNVPVVGVAGYHDVIKEPMDFGTVKRRVLRGEYRRVEDVEGDVRKVFGNCFRFNNPGDPVYVAGQTLEKLFNLHWADLGVEGSDAGSRSVTPPDTDTCKQSLKLPDGPSSEKKKKRKKEKHEGDDDDDDHDHRDKKRKREKDDGEGGREKKKKKDKEKGRGGEGGGGGAPPPPPSAPAPGGIKIKLKI